VSFEIIRTSEADRWIAKLGERQQHVLAGTLELLARDGPNLGRPLADRIGHSRVHKLKELRVPTSNMRVLFAFDSKRRAVLLVGGDKTNEWQRWYRSAIPAAEQLLARHERTLGKEVTWRPARTGGRPLAR
jgi:hypothetical protein